MALRTRSVPFFVPLETSVQDVRSRRVRWSVSLSRRLAEPLLSEKLVDVLQDPLGLGDRWPEG